jgi:ornithine decarboxylase
VDIGGGFPGWGGGGIGIEDIAKCIEGSVREMKEEGIEIIAEPGRFFVEGAFAVVCKIFSVRVTREGEREYFIAQGVEGVFKDVILCDEVFIPVPLREEGEDKFFLKGETAPCTIRGPAGEGDIVAKCNLPKLEGGDWLVFERMGAYTMSIAKAGSNFETIYV